MNRMQLCYYGLGVLYSSIEYKNVSRDRIALQAGWPPGEPPGVSVVNVVNGVNGVNGLSKKTRRRRLQRLQPKPRLQRLQRLQRLFKLTASTASTAATRITYCLWTSLCMWALKPDYLGPWTLSAREYSPCINPIEYVPSKLFGAANL